MEIWTLVPPNLVLSSMVYAKDGVLTSIGHSRALVLFTRSQCVIASMFIYPGWHTWSEAAETWFFVHWDESIVNISRAHISHWIVEVIKEAYVRADLDVVRVKAHQVRPISTSWACLNQIPMDITFCQPLSGGHKVSLPQGFTSKLGRHVHPLCHGQCSGFFTAQTPLKHDFFLSLLQILHYLAPSSGALIWRLPGWYLVSP